MCGNRSIGLPALILVLVLGAVLCASPALAGGPLTLHDASTRTPNAYPPGTVDVFTDLGPNGMLTNDESDSLVARAFAQWNAVPTSYFDAAVAGEILVGGVPTDITVANVDSIISTQLNTAYNGGGIHVIYDDDGTIISTFFGAPPGVAGVASPEFTETGSPNLLESWVVINGSLIDPGDTLGFAGSTYMGVYTHEIGHAINLAHTQTNGTRIFLGDEIGASGCPVLEEPTDYSQTETMYPFIDPTPGSTGIDQATVDHPDDVTALSNICPAGGWPSTYGTITGRILLPDGTSELSGVNVIARNLAAPMADAVSAISGDYTQGTLGPDGLFTLNGLTPGAEYVVYVDAIEDGGFSTPPTSLPFPEEYYNGPNESGDVDADTTCSYVTITPAAGSPVTADILLNIDPSLVPVTNVDPVSWELPFSFPFCGEVYDSVWIDPDGFLSFGAPDGPGSIDGVTLRSGPPRITGFWSDLAPADGGTVTALESGGNFLVSFDQVPEYLFGGLNTFTITLRPNGTHRIDFGAVDAVVALVGRSPGGGASDPGQTDLSTAPQPLGSGPTAETVYEEFFLFNDMSHLSLEYDPCGTVVGIEPGIVPARFALLQSRPNPFRSATTIAFDLPRPGPVTLQVFDVRGRRVTTLVNGSLEAGRHSYPWTGVDERGAPVGPGIYFYRLRAPGFEDVRKAIRID